MKRIIIAGGSGFLGGVLTGHFEGRGDEVRVLTRRAPRHPREIRWDAQHRGDWESCLEGADVLVNLCGLSVNCRYHAKNRRRLMESRLLPTRLLGEALRDLRQPPGVWMNASTATLYRHTFGDPWDETGEIAAHPDAKDAFSIELAASWEQEFFQAVPHGVRPVALRCAMTLGRGRDHNNVLTVLRRLVRLGLGGAMGNGKQFVSFIHEEDLCRAVAWIVDHPRLEGAVNLCAPTPLPNREMMTILRRQLGMPFGLPAPEPLLELGAFFLRTETELILKSRRVIPGKLTADGFRFAFPDFQSAATDLLGMPDNG